MLNVRQRMGVLLNMRLQRASVLDGRARTVTVRPAPGEPATRTGVLMADNPHRPADAGEAWGHAESNQGKLNTCPRHRFAWADVVGIVPGRIEVGAKFTCDVCGGRMPALEMFRYIQGYEAAGGNANDVCPGFNADPG